MSRIDQAIAQRQHLITQDTNALRLVDGAADACPGGILEALGDHFLISTTRPHIPETLADWAHAQTHTVYHKRLDQNDKESPQWVCGPRVDEPFLIKENGLNFELSFQSGYSQGIFLDQRLNRKEVIDRSSSGQKILNTFSYTGAFSVCAASAGACTTTLDLSQPYLDWAKRNLTHNQLAPEEHFFCKGDTFHWLKRFGRQNKRFDGIILDPPTFARDDKGKVFRVEKDYGRLVKLASDCLEPGGWILACTNFRKMNTREFTKMLRPALPPRCKITEAPMPEEYTDSPYLKSVWIDS